MKEGKDTKQQGEGRVKKRPSSAPPPRAAGASDFAPAREKASILFTFLCSHLQAPGIKLIRK